MRGGVAVLACAALVGLVVGCAQEAPAPVERAVTKLVLSSAAFAEGAPIPLKHTCDGDNVSPELAWGEPPAGTRSFALVMDDPDAVPVAGHVWDHWVIFNVPAGTRSLPAAVPDDLELADGARHGTGSSGIGYRGPCPPPGAVHHYHFKLFALDAVLDLPPGATKAELLAATAGHVLAEGELVGTYERK